MVSRGTSVTLMTTLDTLAQSEKNQVRITGLKAIQLKGHSQSLIKVDTDAGLYGVGEAGASGPMARAYLRHMEPVLLGQDPLEIEKLFSRMVSLTHPYMAHIPTISGVDIALWDLAGKILDRPVSALLAGRFREEIPLYINNPRP
jgi:L-alanine-DL-glutamate epimerase-like enolase superfamily enzyme